MNNWTSNIPKNILEKIGKIFTKYNFKYNEDLTSFYTFWSRIFSLIASCALNEEDRISMSEFLWYSFRNKKYLVYQNLIIEENYDELINFLTEIEKKNKVLFGEILHDYFKSVENKTSLEEVLSSLLIMRDFIQKTDKLMKYAPMKYYSKKADEIYEQMLKSYNENSFRIAMFDIIVKYGYILETYIKELVVLTLKGYCLKNENVQEFYWIKEEYKRKKFTLGRLIRELNRFETTDSTLSKLRNSIFHSQFIIDYNEDYKQRQVIFESRNWKKEKYYKDFIEEFFYVNKIITTFQFVLCNFLSFESFDQLMRVEFQKFKNLIGE